MSVGERPVLETNASVVEFEEEDDLLGGLVTLSNGEVIDVGSLVELEVVDAVDEDRAELREMEAMAVSEPAAQMAREGRERTQ
jgi:hypothetical protein